MKKQYLYRLTFICLISCACNKFIEVAPPITNPVSATVYENDNSATAVISGIYLRLIYGNTSVASGLNSISLIGGVSSDELKVYYNEPTINPYYINKISNFSSLFWSDLYQYIYTTNAAIEGITASKSLTPKIRQQLLGEAKFIRGLLYFYLVNLFGDVPIILTTKYQDNIKAARTPKEVVYKQIINDLESAEKNLATDYTTPTSITLERIRPNKFTAISLLARIYLYTGNYEKSIQKSNAVIEKNTIYALEEDLDKVFLKESKEIIWQLQPIQPGLSTYEGSVFILTAAPDLLHPVALATDLINAFVPEDKRFNSWVRKFNDDTRIYYYPYKYKETTNTGTPTEYLVVMRLSELFLIRSEAYAKIGNVQASINDLNKIRNRAGLKSISPSPRLFDEILAEKQRELFTEWGHRWLDLKRTGKAREVMPIVAEKKGTTWNDNWLLYPIPFSDIQNAPNLKQNPGY